MKTLAKIISYASLAAVIVPPVIFLAGGMPLDALKTVMLVATVVWFVATPVWMEHEAG